MVARCGDTQLVAAAAAAPVGRATGDRRPRRLHVDCRAPPSVTHLAASYERRQSVGFGVGLSAQGAERSAARIAVIQWMVASVQRARIAHRCGRPAAAAAAPAWRGGSGAAQLRQRLKADQNHCCPTLCKHMSDRCFMPPRICLALAFDLSSSCGSASVAAAAATASGLLGLVLNSLATRPMIQPAVQRQAAHSTPSGSHSLKQEPRCLPAASALRCRACRPLLAAVDTSPATQLLQPSRVCMLI